MAGVVTSIRQGYFWILGGDGRPYFAAFVHVPHSDRKRIQKGVAVIFRTIKTERPRMEARDIQIMEGTP